MATYTKVGKSEFKDIFVKTIYDCNFCGQDGPIDAPHKSGPWANYCEACFLIEGNQNQVRLGTYARKAK